MMIPLNALSWFIAGCMCLLVGATSYKKYRASNNVPSKYLGLFLLVLGVGLVFVGLPPLFTDNVRLITATYLIGQLLLYVSFYFEAQNLWLFVFNARFSKWWVVAPFGVIIILASVAELGGEPVRFIRDGLIVDWRSPQLALNLEALLVLATFWPVGISFMQFAQKTRALTQKLKFASMGLGSIIAGSIIVYQNVFHGGIETIAQSWINIVLFSVIIIAILLPNQSYEKV